MIYDVKVRFERKVVPKEYEHGLAECQFSATGDFEALSDANTQALELIAAAKGAVLTALGSKAPAAAPDKAETTVAPAEKSKGGRPKGSTNKPKEDAPKAATDDFGDAASAKEEAKDEFGDAPAEDATDEFADAPAEVKEVSPKELQSWISGHIQAKRIQAEKIREIMKAFKVARTDDTTPEMRPQIMEAIEKAIKAAKK